jgi:hypothetical protein
MKKVALAGLLIFNLSYLQAQLKNIPAKQGLELEYTVFPMGTVFPCTLKLDTTIDGSLEIGWKNERGLGGKYIVTKAALDSAGTAFWGPPVYDQEITLENDQTMLMLTKKHWSELKATGKVYFDGTMYIQKEAKGNNQLMMEGKPVDAIYLEAETGEARIWVLNNAAMPILLKVVNNPFGVDLQIEKVKQ